jgi:hypothetical protein
MLHERRNPCFFRSHHYCLEAGQTHAHSFGPSGGSARKPRTISMRPAYMPRRGSCSALWRPHFAGRHMTSFGPLVQIFCNTPETRRRLRWSGKRAPRGSMVSSPEGRIAEICATYFRLSFHLEYLPGVGCRKKQRRPQPKSHCRFCFSGAPAGSSCLALTLASLACMC